MILKSAFSKLFKIREEAARIRPGADDGFDPYEKPFLDHLEDLRVTLMKMGATLFVITIACFAFHEQIFDFLQLPAKMIDMKGGGTLWDRIEFIVLSPPEVLMLMIKVSFFTAIILTMPILIYFGFQFILPGLKQVEKKMIIPGAMVGFALFITGVCFAFFLASPIALKFFYVFQNERIGDLDPAASALKKSVAELPLLGVDGTPIAPFGMEKADPPPAEASPAPASTDKSTESATPAVPTRPALSNEMKTAVRNYMIDLLAVQQGKNFVLRYDELRDKIVLAHSKGAMATYQIGKYFEFITRLMLVFGLSFQLPVVVTILVKLELLTARVMRSTRTYAWVIIMVAAAILTPPDIMTLGLLAGPMVILYEICVIIASLMERKREKVELAEEEERRARLDRLYSKSLEDLSEEEKEELHKHEIDQYEKEHAHLYDEDGHEYDEHGHLIGYDPNHDDSWHEDEHHRRDGEEEGDEPVDDHGENGEIDYHDGEPDHEPIQDWPDRESEPESESDHAEPVNDISSEEKESDVSSIDEETDDPNLECCEPSGPVVDINNATREELMTLAGVDDWMVEMIINHRPYYSFEELESIVGDENINLWMERLMLG